MIYQSLKINKKSYYLLYVNNDFKQLISHNNKILKCGQTYEK